MCKRGHVVLLVLSGTLMLAGVGRGTALPEIQASATLVDPERAALLCTPATGRFRIHAVADNASLSKAFQQRLLLNYRALVVGRPGPVRPDEPWRAWSRRIAVDCGRYKIEMEAGYLNANPYGELGAVEDFPRAAISSDDFLVAPWTLMAPCGIGSRGEDPAEYVQVIAGEWIAARFETALEMTHETCETSPGGKEIRKSRVKAWRPGR